jgi:hypothetical protein
VYVSSHLVLVTHINTGYIPTWNTGTVTFPHTKSFWNVQYTCILIFLIIKQTRCTNFSNLFLEWNSICFGQFLCPSSGVSHCTHGNGICHTGLLTACKQDQDGTAVPSCSCSQAVNKPLWHIPLLCVQWETPDDGQRNCPKHVEFHSKINLRN